MTAQERIQKEMTEALRSRAELRLSVLRMMKTAVRLKETEKRRPLDESECVQVFATLINQRQDSAEQFRKGGRPDLADKEEREILVLEGYMPATPSEEEITAALEAAVAETGATSLKQMGVVMKAATARLAGKRVDGKALSERVKARLAGRLA